MTKPAITTVRAEEERMTDSTELPIGSLLGLLIRTELDTAASPDPGLVVTTVAKAIPEARLREAVEHTLRGLVLVYIHNRRIELRNASRNDDETTSRAGWWQAAGAVYMAFLRQNEYIPDVGWKFLGDCTHAEVLAIAAGRAGKAASYAVEAQRFEQLAAAMEKKKASVVADLPADTLERIVRWHS